jgi:tetratricopeptide (TPR) repeat protein
MKTLVILLLTCSISKGLAQPASADTTGRIKNILRQLENKDLPVDSALALGKKLVLAAQEVESEKYRHLGYLILGDLYYDHAEYQLAINYYTSALELESIVEQENVPFLLNDIGRAYRRLGSHDRALEFFFKALELARKNNYVGLEGTVYNNLAIVYESDGHDSLALVYYRKSIQLHTLDHDSAGIALAHSNMAELFLDQGFLDSAWFNLAIALDVAQKIKNERQLAFVFANSGLVALHERNFEKALSYFQESQRICAKLQVVVYQAEGNFNIARAYDSLNNHILAFQYAQQAWEVANKIQALDLLVETSQLLAHLHQEENQLQEALHYQEIATHTLGQLRYNENKAALTNYIALIELEKEELRAEALTLRNRQQRIISYILLGGSLLLMLWILFMWRSIRSYRRVNELLMLSQKTVNHKNEELHRINGIKDKLFSIVTHDFRGPLASLSALVPMLYKQQITEVERAEVLQQLSEQLKATRSHLKNREIELAI